MRAAFFMRRTRNDGGATSPRPSGSHYLNHGSGSELSKTRLTLACSRERDDHRHLTEKRLICCLAAMNKPYHSLQDALRAYHADETARAISDAQAILDRARTTRLKTQAHIEEATRLIRETREILRQVRGVEAA